MKDAETGIKVKGFPGKELMTKPGEIMDFKLFITTFGLVFLAELGDKTQLATLCLSANNNSRISVFLGSAFALIVSSLLAVLFGATLSRLLPPNYIQIGAGIFFIVVGIWMLISITRIA